MDSPNILLIILDSVRARNTSLHGYHRNTTPFLKEFANEFTYYKQARAPGVGSVQSHTSMFTGLHVHEHRMNSTNKRINPERTIWKKLEKDGYSTGAFSYNSYLTQVPIGLKDSFEHTTSGSHLPFPDAIDPHNFVGSETERYLNFIERAWKNDSLIKSIVNGVSVKGNNSNIVPYQLTTNGRTFTDSFIEWHEGQDGPWAATINYMDAHTPYRPDAKFDNWATQSDHKIANNIDHWTWDFISGTPEARDKLDSLENLYDGGILQADAEVRRLINYLVSTGSFEDTLVVITADHGEGFGETSELRETISVGHGSTGGIEEGILHVPLLVHFPRQNQSKCIEQPASLTEFPSVVESIVNDKSNRTGFSPDGPVISSSLGLPDHIQMNSPQDSQVMSQLKFEGRAVYDWSEESVIKYANYAHSSGRFECDNPQHTVFLDADTKDKVAEVFIQLTQSSAVEGSKEEVDENVEARLEKLGYR